jgi:hypothetical protein
MLKSKGKTCMVEEPSHVKQLSLNHVYQTELDLSSAPSLLLFLLSHLYVGTVVGEAHGAPVVADLRAVDVGNAVKVLKGGGELVAVAHQVAQRHARPVLHALRLQRVALHLQRWAKLRLSNFDLYVWGGGSDIRSMSRYLQVAMPTSVITCRHKIINRGGFFVLFLYVVPVHHLLP